MAKSSRGKTPWIVGGLIVFVLADLALVGFALSGPPQSGDAVSAVEPTFTPPPLPTATGTPGPTTAPPATPLPTATPATPAPTATPGTPVPTASAAPALSGMADAKVGYRATPGSCEGDSTSTDAVLELTTDGGTTWTNVTPSEPRIRSVEKLVVVDEDRKSVV